MQITLGELAKLVEGTIVRGAEDAVYMGLSALTDALPDEVSFFGNPKYADDLSKTKAGVVLIPEMEVNAPESVALIRVSNPTSAFERVVHHYAAPKRPFVPGVHPSAVVAEDVSFNPDKVCISPNVVIESGVSIGDGTFIGAGSVISIGTKIGRDCQIKHNVTICEGTIIGDRVIIFGGVVIGSDGYGYQLVDGKYQKIDQLGIVRIGDDVEIGANSTVDRARFGETVIGEGTKIDNLVQIGHNCVIGKHCLFVAMVGVAGSTRVGDYCIFGAQVGVAGHLLLEDHVTVAARSGVINNLYSGNTYFGYPAVPMKQNLRHTMHVKRLGKFFERVRDLEAKVAKLDGSESNEDASAGKPD